MIDKITFFENEEKQEQTDGIFCHPDNNSALNRTFN